MRARASERASECVRACTCACMSACESAYVCVCMTVLNPLNSSKMDGKQHFALLQHCSPASEITVQSIRCHYSCQGKQII